MAIITCPSCKKMVSDSSRKCPNCGAALKAAKGTSEKSPPAIKKLYTFNLLFMYAAGAMVLLEIFEIFTTYVGGILLGIGFFIQAYLQYRKGKDEGTDERRRVIFIIIMGIIIFLVGVLTFYMDLTK